MIVATSGPKPEPKLLILQKTRAPRGTDRSPEYNEHFLLKVRFLLVSKSESMTAIFVKSVRTATIAIFQFRIQGCIRFVDVAFRSEEEVLWRRNPSMTYFWQIAPPPPGSAHGWSLPKSLEQVSDYEYFISIKFRNHPSSGSVGKADYVFQYIYMH